jgi:hypothetical protein
VGFASIIGIYGRAPTLLKEDMDDIPVFRPQPGRLLQISSQPGLLM